MFRRSIVLVLAGLLVSVASARAQEQRPDCYVLSVGVDIYAHNNVPDLKGCESDANLASSVFQSQAGKAFGKVVPRTFHSRDATKERIESELAAMQDLGKAGDYLVVFLSGHGDRAGKKFSFLPHDFDPANAPGTSINEATLVNFADNMAQQGKKVCLIIDACFAGQLTHDIQDVLLKHKNPQGGGIIVMVSSSSSQTSAALGKYSAFTGAVHEGLTGKADYDGNGQVTLSELRHYARLRTNALRLASGNASLANSNQDSDIVTSLSIADSLSFVTVGPITNPVAATTVFKTGPRR